MTQIAEISLNLIFCRTLIEDTSSEQGQNAFEQDLTQRQECEAAAISALRMWKSTDPRAPYRISTATELIKLID